MTNAGIDFDAPDLAARIEQATQHDLDQLPFGVVRLDRHGIVLFFSETELRQSGFAEAPLGKNFFSPPLCVNKREIYTRVTRAMEDGPVDLEFAWKGDHAAPSRELRIRVQSSRKGDIWLFIQRD